VHPLLTLSIFFCGLVLLGTAVNSAETPNVVLILIDDMGWNEMGFAGNSFIETPETDAWAKRGVIFDQAYASAPNCAPTRASLMTGQAPPRHGVYTVVDDRHAPGSAHHKLLAATSRAELASESVTLAEALKAADYTTAMFGMWNLGRGRNGPATPTGQGFDLFTSPKEAGFDKDRYQRGDGTYLTDSFTDAAITWTKQEAADGHPFFLYLAYHAVHAPFEPKPDLLKKYQAKAASFGKRPAASPEYAATVEAVDQNIGRLMRHFESIGQADNTIVVFHSDNGGERRRTEGLRDGKGSLYEGGLRVPTAMWGPGIPVGRRIATPMASIDIYPTVLSLAGLSRPAAERLDGLDLRPLFEPGGTLEREALFWHFPCYTGGASPCSAMHSGAWKIIEHFETGSYEVYNLHHDPQESKNVAASELETTRRLKAELLRWQTETGAPRPTLANPNYDPSAQPQKGRDQRGKGGKANKAGGSKNGKNAGRKNGKKSQQKQQR